MLKVNDTVKVIGKTICGIKTSECIPIGTICKVTEVCEDDNEKYYGIMPLNNMALHPYYYLESDLEKGELKWIPDTTDAKLLHVSTLINLGFVPEDGPRGEKGYTRTIHHMKDETLWITVSLQNHKVYLYNEWDCGGMLWDKTIDVPSEVLNNKDTFMIWLTEQI